MVTKRIILLLIILLMSATMPGCLNSDNNKKKDHEADGSLGGAQRPREMRTPEGVQGEKWTSEEKGVSFRESKACIWRYSEAHIR